MDGQLFFRFFQRHLSHARGNLQALELLIGRCGLGCRGRAGGLGCLGLGCTFCACLAFGFLLLFGTAQAFLTLLKALFGVFGLELLLFQLADFRFGRAVVLHQRDARRANIGTGATLDAVEQVVCLELFMLLAEGKEMQLLRQQAGRAGVGAFAATNTRQCGRRWRQFLAGDGQQAVAGFDQRYIQRGQAKAHHRPAHDQAVEALLCQTGKGQQFANRGADQRLHIARARQRFASEGGDARDQRPAQYHGIMDGNTGADVLAEHADIGRQATGWHFFAGEDLDQLFLATRGVLGGEDLERVAALLQGLTQCGNGFRFVVLDTNQHLVGLNQLHQDIDTGDQLAGAFAHQYIVSGDVRLAFGAVDDQRVDLLRGARGELGRAGEAGATQATDAGLADFLQQLAGREVPVVGTGF